jgi:hypothetical protein
MNKTSITLLICFIGLSVTLGIAQPADDPVTHMTQFTTREEALSKSYLSYMSEIAHGGKARKMEKRRIEMINSIKQALNESGRVKPYKGDATLRDAYRNYWTVLLSVLTEDYGKIMDMEEVAERSYDAMEAYLIIQQKADEKVNEAFNKVVDVYNTFAANNHVTLIGGNSSKLSKRLTQLGAANTYLNQVFLIYFKSTVQEKLAFDALNTNDINGLEQTKGSLAKYAVEGLTHLDTLRPYKNDGSLVNACRKVLEFQKSEAESMATFSDFLINKGEFEKTQKSFNLKPAAKRTQVDVDAYNKSIDEQNKAVNGYNKVNNELNKQRDKVMTNWESTRRRFMDTHFPRKI